MRRGFSAGLLILVFGVLLFMGANTNRHYQARQSSQISVAVPIPLQVLESMGDRFFAANLAVWRVLMTGGESMPKESLDALARVQEDASFLNPAHEDNYVMATSLLPWEGYIEPTQLILRRATESRKKDHFAPFFYGFNQIHFLKDGKGAFEYGQIAASHAQDEGDRQALMVISAAWLERGNDPALAEKIISLMAGELKDPQLRQHLEKRAERQKVVLKLQAAADDYLIRVGRPLERIDQLVVMGILESIPGDPVGTVEFIVDSSGRVGFKQRTPKR